MRTIYIIVMIAGSAVYACARNFNPASKSIDAPMEKIVLDAALTIAIPFAIGIFVYNLPKIFKNVEVTGDKNVVYFAFWMWVIGIILRLVVDIGKLFGMQM